VGQGEASIRVIQETFPEKGRPAYTTIQTTVYRLEAKRAVRRVKKVGNFHIFEAALSRDAAQRRLIDDLLALFGGKHTTGNGTPNRIRQTHAQRCKGSWKNPPKAGKKG
jgi:predicted transcriptional regulator